MQPCLQSGSAFIVSFVDALRLLQSAGQDDAEPSGLSETELTLWLAKAGRWHDAHDLCQKLANAKEGAWIHAWLHRQEGDYGNACYWYACAGKDPVPADASLEDEWLKIAHTLLD